MDAIDSVVQTSDQEELEELASTTSTYWIRNASHITRRREKLHVLPARRNQVARIPSPETCERGSPPRKRRKLGDLQKEHSPTIPLSPRTNLPDALPRVYEGGDVEDMIPTHEMMSTQASTESPTSSPDPLLLFTPPRQPVSPSVTNADASPLGSPLTPVTSPAVRTSRDRTPSPLASSSRTIAPQLHDKILSDQAQGIEHVRYSLRQRNTQQLKPYQFDKLLYKKQMRGIPDAVVSPPRPHRHRHSSVGAMDESSSDAEEYQVGENEEMGDEETQTLRRRKGKERAIDVEAEVEKDGRGAPLWLRDIFPESSSSEDDDDILADVGAAKRREEKKRRRKRLKPFPMKKKDLRPEEPSARSPHKMPSPSRASPRPRPRPRPRLRTPGPPPQPSAQPTNTEEEEEELPAPALTWRRRRSVTFSSPVPMSVSPRDSSAAPEDDFLAPWDNHFHMYEDEFARAQSPFHLTQLGDADESLLSSASSQAPPPTSPHEVIDISSDSESMDEATRKKMHALNRMMPNVMIQKLDKQAEASRKGPVARGSRDSDEDLPLRPGESRKRIRRALSSRSVEIRGDSESSDGEMWQPPVMDVDNAPMLDLAVQESSDETGLSSSEESVIEPIGHQPRPKYGLYQAEGGGAPGEGDPSSSAESDDDEVGRRLSPARPQRKQRVLRKGEAEVDNSIDRMLSRTVYNRPRTTRRRRRNGKRRERESGHGVELGGAGGHRYGGYGGNASGSHQSDEGGGRGHGGGDSRLRVTTSSAKRYGTGRQALLPFRPLPTPPDAEDIDVEFIGLAPRGHHNEVHFVGDETAKARQKAAKLKSKKANLYVFNNGNTHLLGGRANTGHVTVDQEVAASRGPSLRDGQPSTSTSSSKSKFKSHHRQGHQRMQASTLTQLWGTDEQYGDDGFVIPDTPTLRPRPAPLQQESEVQHLRHVTVDLDIYPLPAGLAFPNVTYLGHGWLHELVNLLQGTYDIPSPPSCSMFDFSLYPEMSIDDLSDCLDRISGQLRTLIVGGTGPASHPSCHQWQTFFHALSQHISWLLVNAQEGRHTAFVSEVEAFARRLGSLLEEPIEILPDDETLNPLSLQTLWGLVEVHTRLALDRRRRLELPDTLAVATSLKALVTKLWDFTFGDAAVPLELTRNGLAESSIAQQIAELWICVLNLANDVTFQTSFLPQGVTFWTTYLEILQVQGLQSQQAGLKKREAIWKSIFTLCALSQFSIHGNSSMTPRLPPSWQTIASVLRYAPLSKDQALDEKLSRRVIHKRDEYLRVLVYRCLWLNLKWHWRLDANDVSLVFNRLIDVFRSRHFASLADEQSDFPAFLRHYNLALLKAKNRSDTAFTVCLKLVVRAADDVCKPNSQLAESKTIPSSLRQILSLLVPVSKVSFDKSKPPTNHELSMLYNRFSAISVAIYLEPTESNLRYRLSTARRYVDFKDAHDETRRACIRGSMHLAILLRHLGLPLTDILAWLEDMANVLIDEYQDSDASKGPPGPRFKSGTVLSIQLLLGSIRRILEVSSMDPERKEHKYPDPALLQGAWVHRVFSTATNLSTIPSTGEEIRRVVQAFLDARGRVIPKPRRPHLPIAMEDSQESQDYGFETEQFDFDDPDLQRALGEDVGSAERENREKDKVVCEIIDKHILQAIYRLVCKHFNDPVYQQAKELSFQKADDWVDCWVGCINVVVQNGAKDWPFYWSFGPQSWERIIEPDWRRRVGLRFMYMVLQLHPPAYKDEMEHFVDMLFASIATPNVTIEHEYASLLFSIDKLRHPLFHELHLGAPGEDGDWHMKKHEFIEKRFPILDAMLKSLVNNLAAEVQGHSTLNASNNQHLGSVMMLLNTMKDICERYALDTQARASYVTFCKQISDILSRHPAISNHERLSTLMAWLQSVS